MTAERIMTEAAWFPHGDTLTLLLAADTTLGELEEDLPEYLATDFSPALAAALLAGMEDAGLGVRTLHVPGARLWAMSTPETERRFPALLPDTARALLTEALWPEPQAPQWEAAWVLDREQAFVRAPEGSAVESLLLPRELLVALVGQLPDWRFDFEGQCFVCWGYSPETNRHNVCRDCASTGRV